MELSRIRLFQFELQIALAPQEQRIMGGANTCTVDPRFFEVADPEGNHELNIHAELSPSVNESAEIRVLQCLSAT